MFFVGATGQLLTLILTVCLPCILLFSAQPKAEILNDTLLFENYETHQQLTSIENNSLEIHFDSVENLQSINTEFEDPFSKKIYPNTFRVKWKSLYIESCGNKAPPVFPIFSC